MKKLNLLLASFAIIAVPATAMASEPVTFEHDGAQYVYTVDQQGAYKIIEGVDARTGKRFKLRVGPKRVTGTVGTSEVRFRLSEVPSVIERSAVSDR